MESQFHLEKRLSLINEMERNIKEITNRTMKLKELGKGLPVIEKNTLYILSILNVLKFGISDISRIYRGEGDQDG
jgi:hypothetical protein